MERKYTPGPWRYSFDDTGGPFTPWPSVEGPEDSDVTVVHRAGFKQEFWGDTSLREAQANAHLIAAAPELYEALEAMCEGSDDMLEWAALVRGGRIALTKARGEAQ